MTSPDPLSVQRGEFLNRADMIATAFEQLARTIRRHAVIGARQQHALSAGGDIMAAVTHTNHDLQGSLLGLVTCGQQLDAATRTRQAVA